MKEKDVIEVSVIGTVLVDVVFAKPFVEKLKGYKFYTPYRKNFAEKLRELVELHGTFSDAMREGYLKSLPKEESQLLFACASFADTLNFMPHINMLLTHHTYNFMAGGYIKYLAQIQKQEDPEGIISDNLEMIMNVDLYSEKDFHTTQKDIINKMHLMVADESYGERVYSTGDIMLDDYLQMSKRNIILVGGKSGALKTKFSLKILSGLLKNNDKISILHYAMEDSTEQIIRAYAAMEMHLPDDVLSGRTRKLTEDESKAFKSVLDKIAAYDIEYVNKASYIKDIGTHFMKFQSSRKGRFCVLVIDNLMKLLDKFDFKNATAADDYVTSVIDSWNVKTSSDEVAVIMMHHFKDEQINRDNKREAYRPTESDLRGSTRIRDISTKVFLLNFVGSYEVIKEKYLHVPNIIKRVFIVDMVKNRLGKTGVIRYVAFPEINIFTSFKNLSEWKKKN